jgi:hypothetical protein
MRGDVVMRDEREGLKVERFTLQIQGRGLRIKVRIPGWAIAGIWRYAKEAERSGA